jgi:NAD(P)H-flavin reductase
MKTDRALVNTNMLSINEGQVPLMMKKYNAGRLTKNLFSRYVDERLNVSSPMGRGLCLDKIRRGKVVIFAGGTGIFPFLDLFDLAYEDSLYRHA